MLQIQKAEDWNRKELEPFVRLKENQLKHYFEPNPGLFLAESPKVIARALAAGYRPHSFLLREDQLTKEAQPILRQCDRLEETIPLYMAGEEQMRAITGYGMTRGVICAMYRKESPGRKEIEACCSGAKRIAVLEHVVNPTNAGAIFRNAAALGADLVLLTGGCADPLQRRAIRVSMGTVFQVPWAEYDGEAAPFLREQGFFTIALALRDNALDIRHPRLKQAPRTAVFLGTEGEGLAERTIEACHYAAIIPMAHGVDSLNVAAASAVAFWSLWQNP